MHQSPLVVKEIPKFVQHAYAVLPRSAAYSSRIYGRTRLGTKLTDFERQREKAGGAGEGTNVADVGCYGTRRLLKLI